MDKKIDLNEHHESTLVLKTKKTNVPKINGEASLSAKLKVDSPNQNNQLNKSPITRPNQNNAKKNNTISQPEPRGNQPNDKLKNKLNKNPKKLSGLVKNKLLNKNPLLAPSKTNSNIAAGAGTANNGENSQESTDQRRNTQSKAQKKGASKKDKSPKENNKKGGIAAIIGAPIAVVVIIIALLVLALIFIIVIVIVIIAAIVAVYQNNDTSMGGYYSMRCPEVTVIFTDKKNNYEVVDTKTYPLEEYVAGVIAGEVGFFGSIEVDKTFAIAARSFLLAHDDNCTIESSDRKQVFRELTDSPTDQLAIQAADETKGQVMLSDGKLYSSQYDAFACIAKDANYYTISQANQRVPKEWIESKISPQKTPKWFICNGKENLVNHHGNGISQYGSLYLAEELNYTYDQIINFYLSEHNITISSGSLTSIAGLEVKNTTNAKNLHQPLKSYLTEKGSSIEELNEFIHSKVEENGSGTREGVVTAAVSLINYLYDNYGINIPYYWGGSYQHYGADGNFGAQTSSSCSPNNCYSYDGLDCSGFVSWAIKNGGYTLDRNTTSGFHSKFSKNSCRIKDTSCVGQPGDLINSSLGHVQLIVAVDEAAKKYMVAESTGYGVIMREWDMHSGNSSREETLILFMEEYYNNSNNVDPSY